jgi:hypothetical protein
MNLLQFGVKSAFIAPQTHAIHVKAAIRLTVRRAFKEKKVMLRYSKFDGDIT